MKRSRSPVLIPIVLVVCTLLFGCDKEIREAIDPEFVISDSASLRVANERMFLPGETIRIHGTVPGRLVLTESGTEEMPIVIRGGKIGGILLYNCGNIQVRNVELNGPEQSGISIYSDDGKRYANILIDGVKAYGYPYAGIESSLPWFDSPEAGKSFTGGFDNLVVRDCVTYDNDYAGIALYGSWPNINNTEVKVINSKAYDARGVKGRRPHSGHGIVVAGTDGGLIDSCAAWNNGWEFGHGNIGIWTHDSRRVTISNSRSVFNKSVSGIDGGGFDIDGGASDCLITDCYSEGNHGAGYLLFEYGSPNPFTRNSMINNVSIRDGQRNQYSAFSVGGMVPVPGEFLIKGNRVELLPGKIPVTHYGYWPENLIIESNSWQ